MKSYKQFKKLIAISLTAAFSLAFAACGSQSGATEAAAATPEATAEAANGQASSDAAEVRKVRVAVAPGFYPITYADDDGNAAGYDVEVFKALDELLPQYEFEYEIADKETMNVGVQAGSYQVGINSLFKTAERVETYYIPENNMGYTAVGIIQREDDNIDDLAIAHDDGRASYPINANGGIRFVVENWNEANPDKTIEYELVTAWSYADLFAALRAGDYDFAVDLIPVFNLQAEDVVQGLKITDPIDVVPTYSIVNKSETELGDAINEALATLKENGTLSKLSVDAFGYDVFEIAQG